MAIEDILNALEDQAAADIDAVLTEAREHADHIVAQGKTDAQGITDGFAKTAERNARTRASKVVNAARLEAKMAVSSARGNGVDAVFAEAGRRLGSVRDGASYDALFAELAAEALAGAEGDVVVHVDPADEARAVNAVQLAGVAARVAADLSSAGGLVVESNGGRIIRRNTLEDRLDRVRQVVQADVAKVLLS